MITAQRPSGQIKPSPGGGSGPDWQQIINHLATKAHRRWPAIARCDITSLAGLALARATAYYDPARATCCLRTWLYAQGWRLLLSEVRGELRRRRRHSRETTLTDLIGAAPTLARLAWAGGLFSCGEAEGMARHRLLDGLSLIERRIVTLRAERMTLADIGAACGLSGEAIRQRLMKIRNTLGPIGAKELKA